MVAGSGAKVWNDHPLSLEWLCHNIEKTGILKRGRGGRVEKI
jgi:hypothetical protein